MVTRIIWGLLLGVAFLFVCLQSLFWVVLLFALVHLISQYEYSTLPGRFPVAVWWHLVASTICWLVFVNAPLDPLNSLNIVGAALVVAAALYIPPLLFQPADSPGRIPASLGVILRPLLLISLPLALIPAVIYGGLGWFLLLIGASWVADTGAIFAGKLAGKTPLAPKISPKKTVEGVVGGALAAGLVWAVTPSLFGLDPGPWSQQLGDAALAALLGVAGVLVALAGVCGDLMFSRFKREAGVKDYGSLIPGHGGVLDRFDSMLFVAPLVLLLYWL